MRRDRKRSISQFLLVGGIVVAVFLFFFFLGTVLTFLRGGGAKSESKVYTRDEFRSLVMGKSENDVLKAVGRPDKTSEPGRIGRSHWYYDGITRDPVSGKVDASAQVVFQNGVVDAVNFH